MQQRNWKGLLQLLFGLGITVLFFYMMAPFIVATLIGAVIAIISYPCFSYLRQRAPRPLSAAIVTSGLTIGVLLPMVFVLYVGSLRLLSLVSRFRIPENPTAPEQLLSYGWINTTLAWVGNYFPIDELWLKSQAIHVIQNIASKGSGLLAASIGQMPTVMVGILVVILSLYFFLVDGERFVQFLSNFAPFKKRRSTELYRAFETSCRGVVIGLFASGLTQGMLMAVFFWLTGLPNPLLIGALSVGMGMVPLVGTAPIWIGAVIYLFVEVGSGGAATIMLLGGILISLSDNVVRTLIMQGQSEMHPFLALVSVFGAVNLIGASGIFLGPIIAAVFVSFLKILVQESRANNAT